MAYQVSISLCLGATKTGLTLSAQLVNTSNTNVGSAITSGFSELGEGFYMWAYDNIPDGHRGGVKFYESGETELLTFVALNPEMITPGKDAATNILTTPANKLTTNYTGQVQLSSDGLDSIPITAPTGVATTFRGMIVQTWRWFFKRSTVVAANGVGQIRTYADNGSTILTTQTITDDGTTQDKGSAA